MIPRSATYRAVIAAMRLDTATGEFVDWRRQGSCAGSATPEKGSTWDNAHPDDANEKAAKYRRAAMIRVCQACPVLALCTADTEVHRPSGVVQAGRVWGELTRSYAPRQLRGPSVCKNPGCHNLLKPRTLGGSGNYQEVCGDRCKGFAARAKRRAAKVAA